MKHFRLVYFILLACAPVSMGQDSALEEALKRGGPLRAFSNVRDPYTPMDISKAEPHDDYVKVVTLKGGKWAALRTNGDIVSNEVAFDGKKGVAAMTSKGVLYKDGRIEILHDHGKGIVVERGGKDLISTAAVTVAITEGGKVKTWGPMTKQEDLSLTPVDLS